MAKEAGKLDGMEDMDNGKARKDMAKQTVGEKVIHTKAEMEREDALSSKARAKAKAMTSSVTDAGAMDTLLRIAPRKDCKKLDGSKTPAKSQRTRRGSSAKTPPFQCWVR